MTQIKALNCPQCGGSIPDTSQSCDFCGSKVVLTDDKTRFILAGIICPKCSWENKQESKFCGSCGHSLSIQCPSCSEDIGLDTDYCHNCGTNVEAKLKELLQAQGSKFLLKFPNYGHRCEHLKDEIKGIDERLLQENEELQQTLEIRKLLKKEKILIGLNYFVYAMIVVLLAVSYLAFR